MIKTITVQAGQDLFDIALQELGAIDGVFELANLNGINVLTDTISAGSLLKIDTDKIVNQEVVDTYKAKAITPSTPIYVADAKPDYLRSIRSKRPLAGAKISYGSYIIANNVLLTPSDGSNLTSFTLQLFGNFTQLISNDWLIDKVQEYSVIITDDTVPVLALHIQGSDNEDYYYKSEIGLDKFEGNNLITITVDVVLHLTSFYLDGELINAVNQNLPTNITNGFGSTFYIGEEADTYYYLYQLCMFAECLDADTISDIWNYGRPDLVAYGSDLSTVLNLSGINASSTKWKDTANNFEAVGEGCELLTINPYIPSGFVLTKAGIEAVLTGAISSHSHAADGSKENVANKAVNFLTVNDTLYPTVNAVQNQMVALLNGLNWKHSVKYSTTTGENLSLTGLTATVDGASRTLTANDRILVKNQTDKTQNGIYNPNASAWTRCADANTGDLLTAASVYVLNGTTEIDRIYTVNVSPITLGSTQITFALIGPGTYSNGTYLSLTGNVLDVNITALRTPLDLVYQPINNNLNSLRNLTFASASFVKMTGANTFALDTNTYLTSLAGAVLTDQSTPQTIGSSANKLANLYASNLNVLNTYGAELNSNYSGFTNTGNWSYGSNKWTHASGDTGILTGNFNAVIGTKYVIVLDITQTGGSLFQVAFGGKVLGNFTTGTYNYYVTATSTAVLTVTPLNSSTTGSINSISVKSFPTNQGILTVNGIVMVGGQYTGASGIVDAVPPFNFSGSLTSGVGQYGNNTCALFGGGTPTLYVDSTTVNIATSLTIDVMSGNATKIVSTGGKLSIKPTTNYTDQFKITDKDGNVIITFDSVNRKSIVYSKLNITSIPTYSSGLVSGDIWSNSGVLTIVT